MKEIARWDYCGQGRTEQYIVEDFVDWEDDLRESSIGILTGEEVMELLAMKQEDMDQFHQTLVIHESPWLTRDYYIYYNYHPNGGYKTVIKEAKNGEIEVQIKKSTGFTLSACWSEVIIFRLD